MEPEELPLSRGSETFNEYGLFFSYDNVIQHSNSETAITPRLTRQQTLGLIRRANTYEALTMYRDSTNQQSWLQDATSRMQMTGFVNKYTPFQYDTIPTDTTIRPRIYSRESILKHWQPILFNGLINLTSGTIAMLLSSTLAVSCASVIVGHGTPLSSYIAHFIDMNFVGTAVLSFVLAWKSSAPWTLGAMDVFVAPIMSTMAKRIGNKLDHDMTAVVPTTIMMVVLTSTSLGVVFMLMGTTRMTSIANYMPYPVIAGFLSGVGAELMKNGIHMATGTLKYWKLASTERFILLAPALCFAGFVRFGQFQKWPVGILIPCLLALSMFGFHFLTFVIYEMDMRDVQRGGWVFFWPEAVLLETPLWWAWIRIDFSAIHWGVLTHECMGLFVSLVILGVLKYSVATTSLSTLFGREISPDHEMTVIGFANVMAGLCGTSGGCHYLSAMGIMKQFQAHEKMPAIICGVLLLTIWSQGIFVLQYVPKFIFGGLLLSVGLHFLEAYLISPLKFLNILEKSIVIMITVSFLFIGMLESVGLGILISMSDLIYRIHQVGCVHHETTGAHSRSAVDRNQEQMTYLDAEGGAIFILRLQGYLFFGTSVNILERMATRAKSQECNKLKFVVLDFGLVSSFDATALLNFQKATHLAETYLFEIYFCGLRPILYEAFTNRTSTLSRSKRSHFLTGDVDRTLEICEDKLLPSDLKTLHLIQGTLEEWEGKSQLELWQTFIRFHENDFFNCAFESNETKLLMPFAAYLDIKIIRQGCRLRESNDNNHNKLSNTYFICFGYMDVLTDSEFSTDQNIPGVVSHLTERKMSVADSVDWASSPRSLSRSGTHTDLPQFIPLSRRSISASLLHKEPAKWTPFTTARRRLRKIGPGSIIPPDTGHAALESVQVMSMNRSIPQFYQYVATSDCVVLKLSASRQQKLEAVAPNTAMAVLKLINSQLASHFLHSNKRISQLSSLLYK